jgi:hypothetical protein
MTRSEFAAFAALFMAFGFLAGIVAADLRETYLPRIAPVTITVSLPDDNGARVLTLTQDERVLGWARMSPDVIDALKQVLAAAAK